MKNINKPKNLILYLALMLCQVAIIAQDRVISGRVTDSMNDSGIPGANILIKGTGNGTVTDVDGNYSLTVPESAEVLVFSFVGYETEEVEINGRSTISIALMPDITALEEIVVIGYGEQKKSLVTGAISSVDAEEIQSVSNTRIDQTLQGRVAGVNVLPNSGSPGSGININIRGTGSNGNSQPLYVVDGVITGGIEYLDPNEVQSIEVLKDAASAAIYGAQGGNGVVYITTKKGKAGTAQINYGFQYGVQSANTDMDLMNSQQYATYLDEAGVANGPDPSNVGSVSTNWLDEVFESAPMMRHSLNISGGTEKSKYLIGGSFFDQDGIIGGDKANFQRYTFRLNTEHEVKDWLTVGNNMSFSHFERSTITEDSEFGGVINNALLLDPLTPTVYTGSLPGYAQQVLDNGYTLVTNDDGQYYGISQYVFGEIFNPLAGIQTARGGTVQDKIVGNIYANIKPVEWLKFTTRFGIDAAFQRFSSWTPTFYYSSERLNTTATVNDSDDKWFNWQWDNFVNIDKSFDNHNFNVTLGTTAQKMEHNYLFMSGGPMFKEADKYAYYDFLPDDNDRVGGRRNVETIMSYYFRVLYDYQGKYLFNITGRYDGSSKLHPDNRWDFFPSVSAGWVISEEGFYSRTSTMNFLKLRASWGENGSVRSLSIGQYAALITTEGIRYPNANSNYLIGAEPDFQSNPDLKWETSRQIDVGLEAGFFNDKLTLEFDYYRKETVDLITLGTPPLFSGNDPSFINGGTIQNQGIELALNWRDQVGDFNYSLGANFTTLDNEVTALNENVDRIGGTGVGTGWTATFFEQGYPIWYFSGYKTDGIFQNQAEIDAYVSEGGLTGYTPVPGDPRVVDVNGDGSISPDDQTYIGDPFPDFIYAVRATASYKGLDFLLFLQGKQGNDILMGFNRTDRPTANKPAFYYEDRWTGEGSTNSWFRANTDNPFIYNSDLMVFDGSYMRIRQLQVGYTLPENIFSNAGISKLRFYVSLDNFFTFTDYPGLDPEAGSANNNSLGIDRGVYPIPRVFLTGLNVTF
ncbi:TonB-dependent receptor [Mangrovivirga sp. M17]|uniref:TonB-dependent receptor n=1 Tax=Mangrovivirga halotolerans TaxID=2993936 RepID=A0ABT3RLX8_9BACT|nr:TonB-dependent receptor [Mangrovivirga halotolerans]MCX2742714.1 TonB-dependent receptor [Mangrovivirga halotolerans]